MAACSPKRFSLSWPTPPQARDRARIPALYVAGVELLPYVATLGFTAVGILAGRAVPVGLLPVLTTSLYGLIIALVLPRILGDRRVRRLCGVAAATSLAMAPLIGATVSVLAAMGAGAVYLRLTRPSQEPVAAEGHR